MADATFDAIVIGGGVKGLATALYLARYGGMSVAICEERLELGGGWASQEGAAPGFVGDTHARGFREWYFLPLRLDFPDFEGTGVSFVYPPGVTGVIIEEDQSSMCAYGSKADPTGERTINAIAQFAGERDADTWSKLLELNRRPGLAESFLQSIFNIATAGEPEPLERWFRAYLREPDCLIDERWPSMSLWQAAQEFYESPGFICFQIMKYEVGQIIVEITGALNLLTEPLDYTLGSMCFAAGGNHTVAHACLRLFWGEGGKSFSRSRVVKVLIENGRAMGVRLADGSQIAARQVVVSTVDPYQLCFQLIGAQWLSPKLLRKVANLERSGGAAGYYVWAVHEMPKYKAAATNPDLDLTFSLHLGKKDLEPLRRAPFLRRAGLIPPIDGQLNVNQWSHLDRTRVPEGTKHVLGHTQMMPPAHALTEMKWLEFKRRHAQDVLREWQKYAPNMTWDNVIGYDAITPYDIAGRLRNMAPAGNWGVIDMVPSQRPPFNPIPELAQHRTPVARLYATGSAWGRLNKAHIGQGYTCYKAIAEDLGLRQPWKENGRPF